MTKTVTLRSVFRPKRLRSFGWSMKPELQPVSATGALEPASKFLEMRPRTFSFPSGIDYASRRRRVRLVVDHYNKGETGGSPWPT